MLSASVFPDCCRKAKTYNAAVAMSQHIETADSLYYTKESAVLRISLLLLVAGLEPARCCHRGILSPLRLPVSPQRLAACGTKYTTFRQAASRIYSGRNIIPAGFLPQLLSRLLKIMAPMKEKTTAAAMPPAVAVRPPVKTPKKPCWATASFTPSAMA